MVIAVVAMAMMQASVDQEIDMVSMRHPLVPAIGPVITPTRRGAAQSRVYVRYLNGALIGMVLVDLVEMTVMHVVDVVPMTNLGVATRDAVTVVVPFINLMDGCFPSSYGQE